MKTIQTHGWKEPEDDGAAMVVPAWIEVAGPVRRDGAQLGPVLAVQLAGGEKVHVILPQHEAWQLVTALGERASIHAGIDGR